jgi:hypothetical protein
MRFQQIQAQGIDPEAALRTATKAYIEAVQAHESR